VFEDVSARGAGRDVDDVGKPRRHDLRSATTGGHTINASGANRKREACQFADEKTAIRRANDGRRHCLHRNRGPTKGIRGGPIREHRECRHRTGCRDVDERVAAGIGKHGTAGHELQAIRIRVHCPAIRVGGGFVCRQIEHRGEPAAWQDAQQPSQRNTGSFERRAFCRIPAQANRQPRAAKPKADIVGAGRTLTARHRERRESDDHPLVDTNSCDACDRAAGSIAARRRSGRRACFRQTQRAGTTASRFDDVECAVGTKSEAARIVET
jgi:hypothetical protein